MTRRQDASEYSSMRVPGIDEDGCRIDQDVEMAVAFANGVHQAANVRRLAQIGAHEVSRAACTGDQSGRSFAAVLVDVGEDELRSLAGRADGGGAAEAGRSTGDDRYLVVEFHAGS